MIRCPSSVCLVVQITRQDLGGLVDSASITASNQGALAGVQAVILGYRCALASADQP
jgi:hypothetical protein